MAVILLPQAIAFALVAELPPEMGLYTAIVAAVVGALWGSSHQIHTGPTNAISLLVLSTLLTIAAPGTPQFIVAAGMMAVMVGIFQLVMGLARLGVLVNFVSHSVVVGFSSGAGVLIAVNQLQHLFGLSITSHTLVETLHQIAINLLYVHPSTTALGIGTIVLIAVLKKINPRLPAALLGMVLASVVVFLLGLDKAGVSVIGQLPGAIPPLSKLPLYDLEFISQLSTGALAIGAIGLVETMAIARSIASQTGQRLDSNQEFVGQGLSNIVVGFLSGYPAAGSFSRSAVNFRSGAQTAMSAVFSSGFVLLAMVLLAPLAAYLPRAALAGVLIVTAYGMVNKAEIVRIWQGTRGDALIMLVTFLGTLFLHIEFAVLLGIMLSFALYIMKSSVPTVQMVVPDESFSHFVPESPTHDTCPQLGIVQISGDLYFGAVSHVEETIHKHLLNNPGQRFLLFRMHSVNQCDFSGIHTLESIRHTCRERGGDIFFVRLQKPVRTFMKSTGFYDELGEQHFLDEEEAVGFIFQKILDPAICIYECSRRAFKECQNLPKQTEALELSVYTGVPVTEVESISPQRLWESISNGGPTPLVIDVREPREYRHGHIPVARLLPLPRLLSDASDIPQEQEVIFVCRGGRRSTRAIHWLKSKGYDKVKVLQGGMLAWEAAGLLQAIED